MGVGGACGWLRWLVEDAAHVELAEESIGRPIDRILGQWRLMEPVLLDLGDEALRLVPALDDG
jgi:hypothetical protein